MSSMSSVVSSHLVQNEMTKMSNSLHRIYHYALDNGLTMKQAEKVLSKVLKVVDRSIM